MDDSRHKPLIELLEKQSNQAFIPDEEVECVKHSILRVLNKYGIEADKVGSQSIPYQDYNIIGNTFAIHEILIKNGIINISNEDVLATLNSLGTNYVTIGLSNNGTALEAFENALKNLRDMTSCRIGKILFNIWLNTEDTTLPLAAMKSITDYIERELKDIDVLWGVAIDKSLENKIRVTLLAASK